MNNVSNGEVEHVTIKYGKDNNEKSILVKKDVIERFLIENGSFIKDRKKLEDRTILIKGDFVEKVLDKAKEAGIELLDEKWLSELSENVKKAFIHAFKEDFEKSDIFTSKYLINSFAVKNPSDKVGMEGIGVTLENAKNISKGSIDVVSNQLDSSLNKLKGLVTSFSVKNPEQIKELKGTAKLAGKLAQSLGRLVPMATMGALKSTNATKAGKISEVLNKIEIVCKSIDKIEKMPLLKREELIDNIKSLGTYKDNKGNVELTMHGLRDEMKKFAEASFKYEGTEAKLTAEKIGVDLRMNQMIDTIVDLMEDLDKEYSKDFDVKLGASYDSTAKGLKKDVQDTFAKLGFLLEIKNLNNLNLAAGFERARKTRNVMENVRNMPMFSEFKYADLNKNLTKKLFEGVLRLKHGENKDVLDDFYKKFEESKKEVEKEIENVKEGKQAEKKEIGDAIKQIKTIEDEITKIENRIETAKKNEYTSTLKNSLRGKLEEQEKKLSERKETLREKKEKLIFEKFKGKQVSLSLEGISVEHAKELLVAIDAKFDKLVEETGASKGGMRGRNGQIFNLRFNEATGSFNLQVEFDEKDDIVFFKKFDEKSGSFLKFKYDKGKKYFVNDKGDKIEDEKNIPDILKEIAKNANGDASIPEILSEIAKNHTFSHSYQTNVTADHDALKKEWVDIINNPITFLKEAVDGEEKYILLSPIYKKGEVDSVKDNLRTAILNTKTGNKLVAEETLGNLVEVEGGNRKSVRSFAGIIEDNGLRTICGPSGTTTDTIVGMFGVFQKDFIRNALKEFAGLINDTTKNENVSTSKKGRKIAAEKISEELKKNEGGKYNNLKKIFSSIANYMINGQYHSPDEVLVGLSTAALSVIKYGDDIDRKDAYKDSNKKVTNEKVREFAAQADVICKVLGDEKNAKWLFPFDKAA